MGLLPILLFTRKVIQDHVKAGGIAIDATVGNGHDTFFLAQLVGDQGKVYGFDIQAKALENAKKRLSDAQMLERVRLIQVGHQHMASVVESSEHKQVQAIMFNLGYLPGGDKSIVTQPDRTIEALEAGLQLLAPGGVITAVLYRGHKEGAEEADQVLTWGKQLDQTRYHVLWYQYVNQKHSPPTLLAIESRG